MKTETVKCPIKGHKHELELKDHPERPGLSVAYCGGVIVYQAKKQPQSTYRKRYSK